LYTRRGDKGETSLFGAARVPKDSPIVEAYGTIDELNSFIGVIIAECKDKKVSTQLKEVQKMLFVAGADAASEFRSGDRVPRIGDSDTARLEEMTDPLVEELPKLRNFILPGGSKTAAQLQFARTLCRRAERRIVTASKILEMNPALLPFFNRLSSYLFNLSRLANKRAGKVEEVWKGRA